MTTITVKIIKNQSSTMYSVFFSAISARTMNRFPSTTRGESVQTTKNEHETKTLVHEICPSWLDYEWANDSWDGEWWMRWEVIAWWTTVLLHQPLQIRKHLKKKHWKIANSLCHGKKQNKFVTHKNAYPYTHFFLLETKNACSSTWSRLPFSLSFPWNFI